MVLEGFTDADIAGDIDNKRSTSRYLITFVGGLCHGTINCISVLPYS